MFLTVERLIARLTAEAQRASDHRPLTVRFVAVDLDRPLERLPGIAPDGADPSTTKPKE